MSAHRQKRAGADVRNHTAGQFLVALFSLVGVTYHTAVRKVRKTHGNAMVAIGMSLLQSFMFLAAFYLMFTVIGARTMAIRGDFMLYLLTGIFMYLVHIQALQAVLGSENSTSPMMQHAPMNTLVAILSSALSVLYVKTISLLVVLFTMHTLIQPSRSTTGPAP
jgi:ABC-type polysaccharide/polyol phosphate export permease